eukprot:760098-Hanusia_phi.AAC.2
MGQEQELEQGFQRGGWEWGMRPGGREIQPNLEGRHSTGEIRGRGSGRLRRGGRWGRGGELGRRLR